MKHKLSGHTLIPTLAVLYAWLKPIGIKMHAINLCFLSQLLVSVLFIIVPTKTENSKFFS